LLRELELAARSLVDDPPGAVVLTGGERLFAAGADIGELEGPERAREIGAQFHATCAAIEAIPRATIAAVAGVALGGGCELTLACDFRVVSTKAIFGLPEILLGIFPGGGGTQRLARLIGPARAKAMIFSGRQVGADEALALGLADEVVSHDDLHARALELAAQYARGAVVAQGLAKRAIHAGLDTTLAEGLALELDAFGEAFATDDARIGIASFLEQGPGKAIFTGR